MKTINAEKKASRESGGGGKYRRGGKRCIFQTVNNLSTLTCRTTSCGSGFSVCVSVNVLLEGEGPLPSPVLGALDLRQTWKEDAVKAGLKLNLTLFLKE